MSGAFCRLTGEASSLVSFLTISTPLACPKLALARPDGGIAQGHDHHIGQTKSFWTAWSFFQRTRSVTQRDKIVAPKPFAGGEHHRVKWELLYVMLETTTPALALLPLYRKNSSTLK